jgi:predicted esterase
MRSRFPNVVSRRRFLGACAAVSVSGPGLSAAVAPRVTQDLDIRDITVTGDRQLARRALVLSPKHARGGERFPVLVLLHGLGETDSEELGVHAWSDRYGLIDADAHLRHPPVSGARRYLSDERIAQIDAELARMPYRGFVLVCPFTPNIYKLPPPAVALDRYADWIVGTLLPAVRANAPATTDVAATAIDGVSLGGFVAFEVFLRKPEMFGAVGGVQTAIGDQTALGYAARLRALVDRVGPRAVHIESSIWDPSLPAHMTMSKRLHQLGVPHDLDVLTGGHDQIFLREVGTLEMLLWHDRRLQK